VSERDQPWITDHVLLKSLKYCMYIHYIHYMCCMFMNKNGLHDLIHQHEMGLRFILYIFLNTSLTRVVRPNVRSYYEKYVYCSDRLCQLITRAV
jgi:hypothetical protein